MLVSSTVRDLIVGSGQALTDRGEHDLKGVPGPWRIYAVASQAPPRPLDRLVDVPVDMVGSEPLEDAVGDQHVAHAGFDAPGAARRRGCP